jgi:hypothetical protein
LAPDAQHVSICDTGLAYPEATGSQDTRIAFSLRLSQAHLFVSALY